MNYLKKGYECPEIEELAFSTRLSLLVNLSVESDFEEIDFEDFNG